MALLKSLPRYNVARQAREAFSGGTCRSGCQETSIGAMPGGANGRAAATYCSGRRRARQIGGPSPPARTPLARGSKWSIAKDRNMAGTREVMAGLCALGACLRTEGPRRRQQQHRGEALPGRKAPDGRPFSERGIPLRPAVLTGGRGWRKKAADYTTSSAVIPDQRGRQRDSKGLSAGRRLCR